MENMVRKNTLDALFWWGMMLKGIDGILEIAGGGLLLIAGNRLLNWLVVFLTQHELIEDPQDIVSNYLVNLAHQFSSTAQLFISLYLLAHGVLKVALVVLLLKQKFWAYPIAMVFFAALIAYEFYRFSLGHSLLLLALALFDVFILLLIWLEYKKRRVQG